MTETLSHHQIEELLPAAALDILDSQELSRVTAHTRECPDCARRLESYREVVAGLATNLPQQPLTPPGSARLRARLLDRARDKPSSRTDSAPGTGAGRATFRRAAAQWAGWAVAAGLAGVLLVHHSIHRPVAYGWLVAGVLVLIVIALAVYLRIQQTRLNALRRSRDSGPGEWEEELQHHGDPRA